MEFPRTIRRSRALNLVPLIDIIFTLILFFMVAGRMETFSIIPVDVPHAESGQRVEDGPIEIVLGADRAIALNHASIDVAALPATLQQQLAANPDRIITVKADARLEANTLVDTLDIIRNAGGKNLSLVTQSGAVGV